MKKYIYSSSHYRRVRRDEIIRETAHNYWTSGGQKISRKTMRIGSGYGATYFHEENKMWVKRWEEQSRIRKYKSQLEAMGSVEDVDFMELIISLEIPPIDKQDNK